MICLRPSFEFQCHRLVASLAVWFLKQVRRILSSVTELHTKYVSIWYELIDAGIHMSARDSVSLNQEGCVCRVRIVQPEITSELLASCKARGLPSGDGRFR